MSRQDAWTRGDDARLLQMMQDGYDSSHCARALGRSNQATRARAMKLGHPFAGNNNRPWSEEQDAELAAFIRQGLDDAAIAERTRRTKLAVGARAKRLGLPLKVSQRNGAKRVEQCDEALFGYKSLASHRLPLNQIAQALAA